MQGAAQIATTSPFSQLDALYTSILSQAGDKLTLTDILHAHFFVTSDQRQHRKHRLTLPQALNILDHKYTRTVIRSCIADVSAIARLEDQDLIFYHASLTNYLMDRSRSGEHFIDLDAFNAKILPPLFHEAGHEESGPGG